MVPWGGSISFTMVVDWGPPGGIWGSGVEMGRGEFAKCEFKNSHGA